MHPNKHITSFLTHPFISQTKKSLCRVDCCINSSQCYLSPPLGRKIIVVNQGVKPNEFVFGATMDACANDGQCRRAISFLNEMEETHGVKPNLTCFNSAICACEKAAKSQPHLVLFRRSDEAFFGRRRTRHEETHSLTVQHHGGPSALRRRVTIFSYQTRIHYHVWM